MHCFKSAVHLSIVSVLSCFSNFEQKLFIMIWFTGGGDKTSANIKNSKYFFVYFEVQECSVIGHLGVGMWEPILSWKLGLKIEYVRRRKVLGTQIWRSNNHEAKMDEEQQEGPITTTAIKPRKGWVGKK